MVCDTQSSKGGKEKGESITEENESVTGEAL